MRAAACAASNEWPPRSKKLSRLPMLSTPRTCAKNTFSLCSISPNGASKAACAVVDEWPLRRQTEVIDLADWDLTAIAPICESTRAPCSAATCAPQNRRTSSILTAEGSVDFSNMRSAADPCTRLEPEKNSLATTAARTHAGASAQHRFHFGKLDRKPRMLTRRSNGRPTRRCHRANTDRDRRYETVGRILSRRVDEKIRRRERVIVDVSGSQVRAPHIEARRLRRHR